MKNTTPTAVFPILADVRTGRVYQGMLMSYELRAVGELRCGIPFQPH